MHRFPQVLRTWEGGSFKMWWGGLDSIHGWSFWVGGGGGGVKTLLKNTYEGVHLLVKLSAISLQACKFTKNKLLHAYFSRILARFWVICWDFPRNHFMEGGSRFNGGNSFLSWGGGRPIGRHQFCRGRGGFENDRRIGGLPPPMGNPASWFLLASAFCHRKSTIFAISRNTNIDCVLIRNLYFL